MASIYADREIILINVGDHEGHKALAGPRRKAQEASQKPVRVSAQNRWNLPKFEQILSRYMAQKVTSADIEAALQGLLHS